MRTQRRLWVVAGLVALLAGCGGISLKPPAGGGTPGGGGGQQPGTERADVTIRIHDFTSPDVSLADVLVSCGDASGSTDGGGLVRLNLPAAVQSDCQARKDGYQDQTFSLVAGQDTELSAWLAKVVPPFQVSRNARQGQLRLTPGGYADDSGLVLPVYAHAGDLFWLWTVDRPRVELQLDRVAEAGYQGVRVWAVLGCGPDTPPSGCPHGAYWKGREIGPTITPGYWDHVAAFAEALRARGLRAVWSQGDIGQLKDRAAYMGRLAALDQAAPFLDFVDCGNEAWQTGEPDPNRLAACVGHYRNAGGRALLTLTSPPGEGKEELDQYSIPPADVYDVHTYRDGHSWDKRRHIFSIPYEVKPAKRFGIGSEPPGNGELVSAIRNRDELDDEAVALLGVASAMARQAFVWFSGEGVKLNQGLYTQAGFWTTPKAVEQLPKDVMTFGTLHHGGDTWRNIRNLEANGETRIDCARADDGRFACTIDGPPADNLSLRVTKGFTGQLCEPGGPCTDVSATAGSTFRVSYRRGRVLVGRSQ